MSDPTVIPGSSPDTQDIEMADHIEPSSVANPPSSLGKRKAGVRARANITSAVEAQDNDIYTLDESDNDEPAQKKGKFLKPAQPSKVPRRGDKGVRVGTHQLDPNGGLPVRANYYPNGPLNFRVFHEDCTPQVRIQFDGFFHSKCQAKVDVISFDPELSQITPNIQNLPIEEKKAGVRKFLATKGTLPPTKKGTAGEADPKINAGKDSDTDDEPSSPGKAATITATKKVPSYQASSSKVKTTKAPNTTSTKATATNQASLIAIALKNVASSNSSASVSRPSSSKGKTPVSLTNGVSSSLNAQGPASLSSNALASSSQQASAPAASSSVIQPVNPAATKPDYGFDKHVGYLKSNVHVWVYAHSQKGISRNGVDGMFRYHFLQAPDNVRELLPKDEIIEYDEIQFKADVYHRDERSTKTYIKSLFGPQKVLKQPTTKTSIKPALQIKEVQKQQEAANDDDDDDEDISAVTPVITSGDKGISPQKSRGSARLAEVNALRKFNQRGPLGQLGQSVQDHEEMNDEELEAQEVAADNMYAQALNAAGPSSKGKAKEVAPSSAGDTIRKLKDENKKQAFTIAKLEQTIRELQEGNKPRVPSTFSGSRIIDNNIFSIIASGPNLGKLMTKSWKKIYEDGKWYKEWTALSEIKLNVGYTGNMLESKRLGDQMFSKVPNGVQEGVWVENVSKNSLYETSEGKFIKWTLREEIEEDRMIL